MYGRYVTISPSLLIKGSAVEMFQIIIVLGDTLFIFIPLEIYDPQRLI
jgi:hypothetical protein